MSVTCCPIKQNSTGTKLIFTIRDCDGAVVPLSGATITGTVKDPNGTDYNIPGSQISITNPGGGEVTVTTDINMTNVAGYWQGELNVSIPGVYTGNTSRFEYEVDEVLS